MSITSPYASTRPASATKQVSECDTVTDWLTVRRTINPADDLLHERTFKWLATLPRDSRPMATARQYPRIANRLGELWSNCEFTRLYLQSLLRDRRGGRKGLPAGIKEELVVLQQYYFENLSKLPAVLWNAVPLAEPKVPDQIFAPISQRTEIEIRPL